MVSSFHERLVATHDFPAAFTFKVIAEANPEVEEGGLQILRELMPGAEVDVTRRSTKGGRHVALSFNTRVPDAATVEVVYERLGALPGLVMLL